MTTTTKTRGSDWGIFANHGVFSDWGDCGQDSDYSATNNMLGNMVVEKFHEIAKTNDSTAYWCPETSEVIADVEENDFDYDEWREEAIEFVSRKWENGDIEPIKI